MCIDLFVPGVSIEVPFLLEQIWIGLRRDDPTHIDMTEVYDLRIRNPAGNPAVEKLWALFPNNCTEVVNGSRSCHVRAWPVTPSAYESMNEGDRNYEWAFEKPIWKNDRHESVLRGYCAVPPDPSGPCFSRFEGRVLDVDVGFPDPPLTPELQAVLAEKPVLKTLVSLTLRTALRPGEEGWLRLKVTPSGLDQAEPRRQSLGPSMPALFSQTLTATCPILVRDRLRAQLDRAIYTADAEKIKKYRELVEILLTNGVYVPGTGVRIGDHRIAMIACDEVDISSTNCTDAALYYGTIPVLNNQTQIGLWWGGGSDRNRETDLVHNAMRVIDLLRYGGQARDKKEIARDLSPSGKYEAFSTLLDEMVKAGLLIRAGPAEQLWLRGDLMDQLDERMVKLRKVYATACVNDELMGCDFSDLHPFDITFRVTWFVPGDLTIAVTKVENALHGIDDNIAKFTSSLMRMEKKLGGQHGQSREDNRNPQ